MVMTQTVIFDLTDFTMANMVGFHPSIWAYQ